LRKKSDFCALWKENHVGKRFVFFWRLFFASRVAQSLGLKMAIGVSGSVLEPILRFIAALLLLLLEWIAALSERLGQ
jgi:hypothetical protein